MSIIEFAFRSSTNSRSRFTLSMSKQCKLLKQHNETHSMINNNFVCAMLALFNIDSTWRTPTIFPIYPIQLERKREKKNEMKLHSKLPAHSHLHENGIARLLDFVPEITHVLGCLPQQTHEGSASAQRRAANICVCVRVRELWVCFAIALAMFIQFQNP